MGKPLHGKYNFPKQEVITAITPYLKKALAAGTDVDEAAELLYNATYVPPALAVKMSRNSVRMINQSLRAMADCGCSGRRKSLAAALTHMHGIVAFNEAVAGLKELGLHAVTAASRAVSNSVAGTQRATPTATTTTRDSTRLHVQPKQETNK